MESKQQKTKILLRGAGSSLVSCEPNPGDPDCLSTAWWLSVLSVSPLPSRNCYWLQHQRTLELLSFPAAHCSPYGWPEECSRELRGLWSQGTLHPRDLGGGTGGSPILPCTPVSSTFQPSVGSPMKKTHASAVLAVKYLQRILASSVGSSEQQGGSSERMFVLKREGEAIFGCKRIWGWADW